jgi:histidine triad (HIT) family protein
MNTECIFCKVISKQIPAEFLYESSSIIVIKDIYPQAKTHFLIIPKEHTSNFCQINDHKLQIEIFETVKILSKKYEIPEYRLQINNGSSEGQTIFHTHVHFLSNSKLKSQ